MATISDASREIQVKVVYYGPSNGGKTTSVRQIHHRSSPERRGRLISLDTEEERTLIFDMLPVKGGQLGGYAVRYYFYTVPGQPEYSAIRRGVLRNTDGIIFVADSTPDRLRANVDAMQGLREDAEAVGLKLETIPLVIQYNKRDVEDALSIEKLNALLNGAEYPTFESVASQGTGVFETLSHLLRATEQRTRQMIRLDTVRRRQESLPPSYAPRNHEWI